MFVNIFGRPSWVAVSRLLCRICVGNTALFGYAPCTSANAIP